MNTNKYKIQPVSKASAGTIPRKRIIKHHRVIEYAGALRSMGPFRFFATLTFQHGVSPTEAHLHASTHWRRVQRKLLGKQWIIKRIEPITGIAVMEKAQIYNIHRTDQGGYHFHYLIKDHKKFSRDDNICLLAMQRAFEKSAIRLHQPGTCRELVSRKGVLVKAIYSEAGICRYVMKEARNPAWSWHDWVFYLGKSGFE